MSQEPQAPPLKLGDAKNLPLQMLPTLPPIHVGDVQRSIEAVPAVTAVTAVVDRKALATAPVAEVTVEKKTLIPVTAEKMAPIPVGVKTQQLVVPASAVGEVNRTLQEHPVPQALA